LLCGVIKMILNAIAKATNNFETGFNSSTLLGWQRVYDKEGREVTCDPNFKSGSINIEGKDYWFVRRRWSVRLWDKRADYCDYMANRGDHIEEIDIKPDYVKEYESNAT